MKQIAGCVVFLVLLGGCIPNSTTRSTDALRANDGVCTQALINGWFAHTVTSCAFRGLPGTLYDDGKSSYLNVEFGATAQDLTRTERYQVTVFRNQVKVYEAMLGEGKLSGPYGEHKDTWYTRTLVALPFDWDAARWEFRYVLASDTSTNGSSHMVLAGPRAAPARRVVAPSRPPEPEPAPVRAPPLAPEEPTEPPLLRDLMGNPQEMREIQGHHVALETDCTDAEAQAWLQALDAYVPEIRRRLLELVGPDAKLDMPKLLVFREQAAYQAFARRQAPSRVDNGGYFDGTQGRVVTYFFNNSLHLPKMLLVFQALGTFFHDPSFKRWGARDWPVWLEVGMAEALEDSTNPKFVAYLVTAMGQGQLPTLSTMATRGEDWYAGPEMNLHYAVAWSAVRFLLQDPARVAILHKFMILLRDPNSDRSSMPVLGPDLLVTAQSWQNSIRTMEAAERQQPIVLGQTLDEWVVHAGGIWRLEDSTIAATGLPKMYSYLVRSFMPMHTVHVHAEVRVEGGSAGVLLGLRDVFRYPFVHLLELGSDRVVLKRAASASQIHVVQAVQPQNRRQWHVLDLWVQDGVVTVAVNGEQVMHHPVEDLPYSSVGLFLYQGVARFRHVEVTGLP